MSGDDWIDLGAGGIRLLVLNFTERARWISSLDRKVFETSLFRRYARSWAQGTRSFASKST